MVHTVQYTIYYNTAGKNHEPCFANAIHYPFVNPCTISYNRAAIDI